MTESFGDVSRIHSKYSVTLFTPSSYYLSLAISVLLACAIVAATYLGYLQDGDVLIPMASVVAVLVASQLLDSRFIRNKEYSKVLHLSLFGNLIWFLICMTGIAAFYVLAKPEPPLFYVTLGAFIFASFRIGIFTTTLGVSLRRAWALCLIQPIGMLVAMVPAGLESVLYDPVALGYGTAFLIIATVWSYLTDKAGRPHIQSTHKLVQAYLSSRRNDYSEIETMIEGCSKQSRVSTSQIRLQTSDGKTDVRLVLPEIHPGPYHPIGGSNIPYLIYKNLDSSAIVMHSISDHALNLPSKQQVENYLESLSDSDISQEGLTCTEPVTVQINKARVVGLLFGKNVLLFMSLSPHGMEDLPSYIKSEIDQYSKNRNFERTMLVDCHNAMGKEISKMDSEDMLKAAKSCLDTMITKESYRLEFGYANSKSMDLQASDLGLGGLGILCLKVNGKKYFFGWADSNNMENGVREFVVSHLEKSGYRLLEICTSDTHFTQTLVRTKQGYYQFGLVTKKEKIADWYLQIARHADRIVKPAAFEILENHTQVKIMGPKIFEDYTKAMDNSLRLTKTFMTCSMILFVSSLFL